MRQSLQIAELRVGEMEVGFDRADQQVDRHPVQISAHIGDKQDDQSQPRQPAGWGSLVGLLRIFRHLLSVTPLSWLQDLDPHTWRFRRAGAFGNLVPPPCKRRLTRRATQTSLSSRVNDFTPAGVGKN
jgi:hypothetical protein